MTVIVSEPVPANATAAIGALTRSLSTATITGAVCGLVIGGVLGRLAMRLLAVTSPDFAQAASPTTRRSSLRSQCEALSTWRWSLQPEVSSAVSSTSGRDRSFLNPSVAASSGTDCSLVPLAAHCFFMSTDHSTNRAGHPRHPSLLRRKIRECSVRKIEADGRIESRPIGPHHSTLNPPGRTGLGRRFALISKPPR